MTCPDLKIAETFLWNIQIENWDKMKKKKKKKKKNLVRWIVYCQDCDALSFL